MGSWFKNHQGKYLYTNIIFSMNVERDFNFLMGNDIESTYVCCNVNVNTQEITF